VDLFQVFSGYFPICIFFQLPTLCPPTNVGRHRFKMCQPHFRAQDTKSAYQFIVAKPTSYNVTSKHSAFELGLLGDVRLPFQICSH